MHNRSQAKPVKAAANVPAGEAVPTPADMFTTGWLSRLHKPGGNTQVNPQRMVEHLAATGGKVFTRFPPEPNGFLHVSDTPPTSCCLPRANFVAPQIGHSKAITVNFGYAKQHGGHCYLRFDDTNPAAEEQIYFDKILENIRWLGFEPYKITYSSDHFGELYDLAVELIKRGKAYTSTDTGERLLFPRNVHASRLTLGVFSSSCGNPSSAWWKCVRSANRIQGSQQAHRTVVA